jgi:hypothetical protein
MKINFNNIRKEACFSYGRLVNELNFHTNEHGEIEMHADDIREPLNDLRGLLGAIACTYIHDDHEFKSLADEIGEIPIFNQEAVVKSKKGASKLEAIWDLETRSNEPHKRP